jgi:hypothetical protein
MSKKKMSEEKKMCQEKKVVDPFLAGFYESMAKKYREDHKRNNGGFVLRF